MSRSKSSAEKKKMMGKKEFYMLISPKYFGEVELGLTPAKTPEHVLNRVIEVSLSDITNDYSLMHVKVKFKVYEVIGNNAYTKFIGSDFTRDYLRSLVRRLTTRVDGIFNLYTSDGYFLRVTALVFTEFRIKHRQKYAIRKIMKEILEEEARTLPFQEFVKNMVYGKTAEKIYHKSKKIAPIRKSEILKIKVLGEPEKAAA
ncbi:MAG: 30S ribosomal protein S3ae [Candidatus Helarchaeota archaeon]